jgi:hypothetical protein
VLTYYQANQLYLTVPAMTKEEMRTNVRRHMDAEFRQDVNGALNTMSPRPFYEFHPLGLRISGREAIAEMYRRMWPNIYPYVVASESLTMNTQLGDGPVRYGPAGLLIREWAEVLPPGGRRQAISEMAVFHFKDDPLVGETIYCNGPLSELTGNALGVDFVKVPGVQLLY